MVNEYTFSRNDYYHLLPFLVGVGSTPKEKGKLFSLRVTVNTLNIGTFRPATVVVLNIKQFYFTMK